MQTGVAVFPTPEAMAPAAIARLVEERGHDALYFPEHTHMPVDHTPHPGPGPLPRHLVHVYDLFVAATAAVQATTRLRVGSGICLIAQRDPITTAKVVASIDHLSGGRFELGVGAGWNRPEIANHGVDPRTRFRVMREHVEAMKEIWTKDEATYDGEFVHFEGIQSWPKPAQRPHPPVLVGGSGATVLDRVLAYGDAWIPSYGDDGAALAGRIAELRGRADREIPVTVFNVPADAAILEQLEGLGVVRGVHWLPPAQRGPLERALERFEDAIAEVHGA